MAIAAIGIVISTLSATGMPVKFGVLMDAALSQSLFVALLVVFAGCTLLGMGMPTLPAYLTVASIAVPSMQSLGLEPLTAHMFVFMIAVASAITPPVAIAAYAAAAISGGKPIATAVVASRIGVMIFLIPFAFAYDPLLLTVKEAGAIFTWPAYIQILVALAFAMYMGASALSLYELGPLPWWQVVLRLLASVLLLAPGNGVTWTGIVLSVVLLAQHRFVHSRRQQLQT